MNPGQQIYPMVCWQGFNIGGSDLTDPHWVFQVRTSDNATAISTHQHVHDATGTLQSDQCTAAVISSWDGGGNLVAPSSSGNYKLKIYPSNNGSIVWYEDISVVTVNDFEAYYNYFMGGTFAHNTALDAAEDDRTGAASYHITLHHTGNLAADTELHTNSSLATDFDPYVPVDGSGHWFSASSTYVIDIDDDPEGKVTTYLSSTPPLLSVAYVSKTSTSITVRVTGDFRVVGTVEVTHTWNYPNESWVPTTYNPAAGARVIQGTRDITISSLIPSTAYYIRVRGYNDRKNGNYSTWNALQITTEEQTEVTVYRKVGSTYQEDLAQNYMWTSPSSNRYSDYWKVVIEAGDGNTTIGGNNNNFNWGHDTSESISSGEYQSGGSSYTGYGEAVSPIYFRVRRPIPAQSNSQDTIVITVTNNGITDTASIKYIWDTLSGNCFALDTPILLPDGTTIPIADLTAGDNVACAVIPGLIDESDPTWTDWTTDSLTSSTLGISQVKNVTPWTHSIYHSFTLSDGRTLKVTAHHPFLVKRDSIWKWDFADKLTVEDILCDSTFNEVGISSIEHINEPLEIMSINVEENDTFIANGIVVHNKG